MKTFSIQEKSKYFPLHLEFADSIGYRTLGIYTETHRSHGIIYEFPLACHNIIELQNIVRCIYMFFGIHLSSSELTHNSVY